MSNPPNPPSRLPPSTPKANRRRHNRRSRRRYPAPVFEFDENENLPRTARTVDMPATPDISILNDSTSEHRIDDTTDCATRFYGTHTLVPAGSVSPCSNGTARVRQQQMSWIRESGVPMEEVYCDITALLFDGAREKRRMEEIPDMILSDGEEDEKEEQEEENVDDGFELVKCGDISEHNGTERRWYRGFRH